ncbi:PD-(D/E)XK nuclease family protein [Bifidobacterium samirii]|nr:PD-(D/E)XK nuclease family protein [Bifidobacterium samirii]
MTGHIEDGRAAAPGQAEGTGLPVAGARGGGRADTLLVVGGPGAGKTTFALGELIRGLRESGDHGAVMAVSGRQSADRLADRVIREIGPMSQARPVTTLSAIAFRLITALRERDGSTPPKLLNGAEQDALLRQVTAVHVGHVRAGDPCPTCALLREYFSTDDWQSVVAADGGDDRIRGVNESFVMQLRDMLARMDELGAGEAKEGTILAALSHWSPRVERLHVQWRLAFALRREYAQRVKSAYPNEYRLDTSRLLVEGTDAAYGLDAAALPRLVVVDDFQDLTLAGLAFLTALHERGVRLVLAGNPDESVQSFRGSYPEYLFDQARVRLGAETVRLDGAGSDTGDADKEYGYRDVVASRISLSIAAPGDDDTARPRRAGKLPALPGSYPIRRLDDDDPAMRRGGVDTMLYRSDAEELDDVTWRIKRAHLADGVAWNDMALIAHDNDTVRRFGDRLRRDGVPVRYSSVTRALRDEPFVQGLFALLELARLRQKGMGGVSDMAMGLSGLAAFVRSRAVAFLTSPLIDVGGDRDHAGRPVRLSTVESAMSSLGALADVVRLREDSADGPSDDDGRRSVAEADSSEGPLTQLVRSWEVLRDRLAAACDGGAATGLTTDDSLVDPGSADDVPFGGAALYLMLAFGDADEADDVLASIQSVCGRDPHAEAFARMWNLTSRLASALSSLPSDEAQYALWAAWDECGVASRWQREALENTDAGRAANDRLDTAMRLFAYAAGSAQTHDIEGFMAQIRSMRIEADSLAKTAPIDQAVTLTTPAGAAGERWPLVWMPAVQQGVWPNLAARNTMFGGEDLADVMLTGALSDEAAPGDPQLEAVLASEQKSLLVAVTRATRHLSVSAAYSDDLTPSDFLYAYLPERFDRAAHADPERRGYTEPGMTDRFHGLDATPRGLVTAARVTMAATGSTPADAHDAADALHLLADHGVAAADRATWPFMGTADDAAAQPAQPAPSVQRTASDGKDDRPSPSDGDQTTRPTVTLSPSGVDGIWACPVCWLMEHRFTGPTVSGLSASFGTLIHAVAQQASEEGLDLPGAMGDVGDDEARIEAITDRMSAIYRELRGGNDPSDPKRHYETMLQDATARERLRNIASYFVTSNGPDYPTGNTKHFRVGTLESAECERDIDAMFGLDDIVAAYNAMDGVPPVTRGELTAIMGMLVGGWPEGMDEGILVRLNGRMDRLEHRHTADGGETIRLIDYKTGSMPGTKQIVNDLQLVCYQMALAFPGGRRSAPGPQCPVPVAQSALFHVSAKGAPADSFGAEGLHQPPLFVDGHLNDTAYRPRFHYPKPEALLDVPDLPAQAPQGVGEDTWRGLLELRGTQAVWALTMVSRVFYAAAACRSTRFAARPQPYHVRKCRRKDVCPACAGQVDTVFETRQA